MLGSLGWNGRESEEIDYEGRARLFTALADADPSAMCLGAGPNQGEAQPHPVPVPSRSLE